MTCHSSVSGKLCEPITRTRGILEPLPVLSGFGLRRLIFDIITVPVFSAHPSPPARPLAQPRAGRRASSDAAVNSAAPRRDRHAALGSWDAAARGDPRW